eukprot:11183897-Lingulodinium_polyedra.AAC.1
MQCHAMPRDAISYHAMPRNVTQRRVMPRVVVQCHVTTRNAMQRRGLAHRVFNGYVSRYSKP